MIVEPEHLIALEHGALCLFVVGIVLCALFAISYVITQDAHLYISATYGCALLSHVYRLYLIVTLLAWRETSDETNGDVRELRDLAARFVVAFLSEATIGALLVGDRLRRDRTSYTFLEYAFVLIRMYLQLLVNTADALVSLRLVTDRDAYIGFLPFVIASLCSISASSVRLYHASFSFQVATHNMVVQNPVNTLIRDTELIETTVHAYGLFQDGPMLVARIGMLVWGGYGRSDVWQFVFMVKNVVQIFMACADRALYRRILNDRFTSTMLGVMVMNMTILSAAIQYKTAFLLERAEQGGTGATADTIVSTPPVCYSNQQPFQTSFDSVSNTKQWHDMHDISVLASLVIVAYGAIVPSLLY